MTFQSFAATIFCTAGVFFAIVYWRELWDWAKECFADDDEFAHRADDVYDLSSWRSFDEDDVA